MVVAAGGTSPRMTAAHQQSPGPALVAAAQPAVNVAALVGHSTLRVATMDDPYRPATAREQARMVALLEDRLAAGAFGLSSGVFYATGAAADIDELALLASAVGAAGG